MSVRKTLLILGAGGYGCTVAEAAQLGGVFEPVGFLDDAYPKRSRVFDLHVFGATDILETFSDQVDYAVVAIGGRTEFEELLPEDCNLPDFR